MAYSPQDVYARHLVSPRGYPLWTPEPNMSLPDVYVREGLKIGDVGVVVPEDGSFDVFFNVCLPPTHSLHRETGVPNNFTPIELNGRDVAVYPEAECAGRIISTSTVARVRNMNTPDEDPMRRAQPGPLNYEFTLSSQEGAVLILPEGAERYYLRNERPFLDAAIQHAMDWYTFAEQRLGRIINHDSLYLITGFYKSRSWSLAAYQRGAGTGEASAQFKAAQVGGGNITASYTWDTTQAMDWRVGPSDRYYNGIPNQTMFIQGFKIAVRESILRTKRVNVKADFPSVRPYHAKISGGSWFSNLWSGTSGSRSSSTTNIPKRTDTKPNSHTTESSSSGDESDHDPDDITIHRFPQVTKPFHPSDIINQYLLAQVPSANVAITHDSQWVRLLERELLNSGELSQENHLIAGVTSSYSLAMADESVVYLQSATTRNDIGDNATAVSMFLEGQPEGDQRTDVVQLGSSCSAPGGSADGLGTSEGGMDVTTSTSEQTLQLATSVLKPTHPVPPHYLVGWTSGLFKGKGRANIDDGAFKRRTRNQSRPAGTAPSPRNSSYHTAESRRESPSPSPVIIPPRNIVFCGEIGTGKSSTINLLLKSGVFAPVSYDSQPCTQICTSYQTTLGGTGYNLWDTRGLGAPRNIFQAIFGRSLEKELKKFLKERHLKNEIDLLVYCIHGSRASEASVKYYDTFCAATRRLAVPVVLVVTHLEREKNMEDWWKRNSSSFEELEMEFDDHACITTLPGHPQQVESRKRLVDVITRSRRWEPEHSGSYFDSPVAKYSSSAPPRRLKGGISSPFKRKGRVGIEVDILKRRLSNHSGSSRNSSYHTAESPRESIPPSPIVVPPTPRSAVTPANIPQINTGLLRISNTSPSTSGEISSVRSSLHSMFNSSPHSTHSSYTSYSEVHLQSCTDENEDRFSDLPFRHSAAIVKRRKGYATRRSAFGDIWECDLISGELSRMVAVKAMKVDTNGNKDLKSYEKELRRELRIWGKLRHRNVVPLLGVVSGFGPLLSIVSPWFSHGSLSHYLARHHMLNVSEKHRLLEDIATGLCYLHSQDVIHGDLHSDNVLIDENGTACLTDFGLSLIKDSVGTSYLKSGIYGSAQFADPALVQRVNRSPDAVFYPTKPCDVYSFGGLMLHVLSGKKPYEEIHSASVIFLTVLRGERPHIPTHHRHITQWHKSAIRMCWDREELKRPSAESLLRMFELQ